MNYYLLTKNSSQLYLLHELGDLPHYIFVDEIFGGDIAGCGASGDGTSHDIVQLMNSNKVVGHKNCRRSVDIQKVKRDMGQA